MERSMKLNAALVERTLSQFEAKVIPDGHPAIPKLSEMFGEHTFFLDESGLSVVEPALPVEDGKLVGKVVSLASWSDDTLTSLVPHRPEPTDIVVAFAEDR
jgi:hypothetical protein